MDGMEPFDKKNNGQLKLMQQRLELNKDVKIEIKQQEVHEEVSSYESRRKAIFVCSWESTKLREDRIQQPWHERLSRIRSGRDPRI
ncbi:hypothetical protein [Saccharibacillus kuerlensis]|uniref:Uncharacterized protein n=1 Tax=Saccharibacillus kuerlensis TaxID=459527 RepID=A0ABQ2L9I0_9BACL|nr:hypothetical protein [Saccharibacillus kuerlensis]GGO07633.1 hypothetical protein GCM10010969_36250 [Saccharibacillus kuerlensis]